MPGIVPAIHAGLPSLNSECLTILLVCGFMFHFCALFQETRHFSLHLLVASMYLAYLALTKVFFGYVIAAMIVLLFVWRLLQRTHTVRAALTVFLLALLWCVPYLSYMYSATGQGVLLGHFRRDVSLLDVHALWRRIRQLVFQHSGAGPGQS